MSAEPPAYALPDEGTPSRLRQLVLWYDELTDWQRVRLGLAIMLFLLALGGYLLGIGSTMLLRRVEAQEASQLLATGEGRATGAPETESGGVLEPANESLTPTTVPSPQATAIATAAPLLLQAMPTPLEAPVIPDIPAKPRVIPVAPPEVVPTRPPQPTPTATEGPEDRATPSSTRTSLTPVGTPGTPESTLRPPASTPGAATTPAATGTPRRVSGTPDLPDPAPPAQTTPASATQVPGTPSPGAPIPPTIGPAATTTVRQTAVPNTPVPVISTPAPAPTSTNPAAPRVPAPALVPVNTPVPPSTPVSVAPAAPTTEVPAAPALPSPTAVIVPRQIN